ncbi:hypothetical protein HPB48_003534 [Haemaphysalis longicornis]|uniref:Uncharacterized protein n=1 Tax=Haemaphysalis longicornis TaxID=44386 RepID=A0A9J6GH60_HAELO|nr:hypothetical protein HPB48_003534 [Haemaphysalis longicornis]
MGRGLESGDSRLAHLIQAKQTAQVRWKGHRLNCRWRNKIPDLNYAIEEHCKVLSMQQWDEV